jgi:hypothetical protein
LHRVTCCDSLKIIVTFSYCGIANEYYRPDLGNKCIENLPKEGVTTIGVLSYVSSEESANLCIIRNFLSKNDIKLDILLLPAHGISIEYVNTLVPFWYNQSPNPFVIKEIDSRSVRQKFLNSYNDFDLSVLLNKNANTK